jgi:hypothetical protein
MAKRVLIFIVLSIILIIIFVKLSEKPRFEKDYQESIKQISEGRYADASKSLNRPHKANYKHAKVLYDYTYAARETDPFMVLFLLKDIPKDYNGPFAEEIFELKNRTKIKERPAPAPIPPEMTEKEKQRLVQDEKKKDNDYLEKLESILRDVKYSSSASDSYRAEQKLRALREEMMNDPKIGVNELKKLDQAIDTVRAMRR